MGTHQALARCLSHLRSALEVWETIFRKKEQGVSHTSERLWGVRKTLFCRTKASLTPPGRPGGVRDAFFQKLNSLSHTSGAPRRCERDIFFETTACLTPLGAPRRVWETVFFLQENTVSHAPGRVRDALINFFPSSSPENKKLSFTLVGSKLRQSIEGENSTSYWVSLVCVTGILDLKTTVEVWETLRLPQCLSHLCAAFRI